ncbi:D-2-hydroxyacid dehydrogenase family protein [Halostreptopolyspora alba]|uniref:D-2-hydroxyacid dehydrogenase family protein n=1 Tax=Halostreptopolyspora alba TaxID=2487137 RepID=A0A3N0EI75_9ACTN|nr:D-2-hydroxyacid dehydrogenase family protein [Nocardiopsaceae bacterium YIM 96095]
MTTRVAVLDDYQDIARRYGDWGTLPEDAELTVFTDHLDEHDALVERLEPFEVVCAMRERTPFPGELLARLPNLRLLVTTGRANQSIDMEAARSLGITVSGTASLTTPTVELTWALILALARRIPQEDRSVRSGGWQRTVGADLHGATLGVMGLGRLGARVAAIGSAFGMRVLAWSPNLTDERAAEHGATRVEREELLRQCDIATIHLKLGDRSRDLVGARELELLGPDGFLVNTSRGPIVNEDALVAALRSGTIAGAGIDVYDSEPPPADHPLRTAPNCVLTPHLGYVTRDNYEVFFRETVEDVVGFLRGSPVRVLN